MHAVEKLRVILIYYVKLVIFWLTQFAWYYFLRLVQYSTWDYNLTQFLLGSTALWKMQHMLNTLVSVESKYYTITKLLFERKHHYERNAMIDFTANLPVFNTYSLITKDLMLYTCIMVIILNCSKHNGTKNTDECISWSSYWIMSPLMVGMGFSSLWHILQSGKTSLT